jgi:hypothetical protein
MRKFSHELKQISFTNGGSVSVDGIVYHFVNTCSIDYFLLAVYLVISVSKIAKERLNSNQSPYSIALNRAFQNIANHLKKNDWNSSRLEWAKTTNMRRLENHDKSITYDFYLSVEEAFGNIMRYYQTFCFEYHCKKKDCLTNGVIKKQFSSSFSQM